MWQQWLGHTVQLEMSFIKASVETVFAFKLCSIPQLSEMSWWLDGDYEYDFLKQFGIESIS